MAFESRNSALRSGVYRSTGTTTAGRIRIPSSFSSAMTIVPSSMPKRLRSFAGTTIAPRLPTFADSISRLYIGLYHLPDIQAGYKLLHCKTVGTDRAKTRSHPALLLANASQILTLRAASTGPRRASDLKELGIIQEGAVLCV